MKKILVLALVVVMVFSVCALTACGIETYTGECHYESWGTNYGCKVDVAVKDGVIQSVRLYSDEDTGWVRTTPEEQWVGFKTTEEAYANFLKLFKGKTVEEINKIVANPIGVPFVSNDEFNIGGATVSSARIILAVQDALSKIPADAE